MRFLQDFIAYPKCVETETSKTKTSRDRIGQTEKSRTRLWSCFNVKMAVVHN